MRLRVEDALDRLIVADDPPSKRKKQMIWFYKKKYENVRLKGNYSLELILFSVWAQTEQVGVSMEVIGWNRGGWKVK